MASIIPFVPGIPEQTISITLDGEPYVMRARWNTSDDGLVGAWYLDAWERDGKTPIAFGIKLVLGVRLGRNFTHPLFSAGLLLIETVETGLEATLQDFGSRVLLVHLNTAEAVALAQP